MNATPTLAPHASAGATAPSAAQRRLPPRRWDVLAFGNPCADIVLKVDRLPAPGQKVLGHPVGVFAGGTEANVACACAKLGKAAAVFGHVGGDAHAAMLVRAFSEAGVDTDHLDALEAAASASALTLLDSSGERTIVYQPMPHVAIDASRVASALGDAAIAYAMPYHLESFLHMSQLARRMSTLVAIDIESAVAPTPEEMRKRVEAADIVFFNEEGLRAATGQPAEASTLASVLRAGPSVVVVSLGAKGALAMDRSCFAIQEAFPTQVVDTTGAGDTFNAAFLVAYLDGLALQEALRFACAAASCTVAAMGARGGLPDRRQVEAIARLAPVGV